MSLPEREYITLCKKRIGEKLRLENGSGLLKQRDLEYLADQIEEASGIRLSLSTLKRLWKEDYDQTPHPSTLQALVSVLGYKDWQDFKLQQDSLTTKAPASLPAQPPAQTKKRILSKWLVLPLLVCLAILFWAITFNTHPPTNKKPVVKGAITFSANKTVTMGVPNTVIFNYAVNNVEADSFFIQQSWNPVDKATIDPAGKHYSSMYYYPGFHRAKLIANDSILTQLNIHITTDGWEPLTRYDYNDNVPVYLQKNNLVYGGRLHASLDNLRAANINMDKEFLTSYFNIRDFDNTGSDNFILDTRVMCDSIRKFACPGFDLMIICEEHIFRLPLVAKGCVGEIGIKLGEVYRGGKQHDLSAFGCNIYQWQHLQLKVINKQATVYLNEQPIYTITFKHDFGKIVGLVYSFAGTGSIDYVRLGKSESEIVYADEFN